MRPYLPDLHETPGDFISDVEMCIQKYERTSEKKSFVSDDGWSFLINDTNDFLRWQYGIERWKAHEIEKVLLTIKRRAEYVKKSGAAFLSFIVPEKSAVYSHYMPGILRYAPLFANRPALILHRQTDGVVQYLFDFLQDMEKFGLTYMRGDTHPNWQGSYLAYLRIHEEISKFIQLTEPVALHELTATIDAVGGDLFNQLTPEASKALPSVIGKMQPPRRSESLTKLALDPQRRQATPDDVPDDYKKWFETRETFVWKNKNGSLPRCVIFRDSTATRFMEYLAEHFSRTVAVWWRGVVVEDVIEREKPDIVIHVQAERFLPALTSTAPTIRMAEFIALLATRQQQREAAANPDA